MKKFLFHSILLVQLTNLKGQTNLVPNPAFETYTVCPSAISFTTDQVPVCAGWYNCHPSADYLNVCATNTEVAIPVNRFGSQIAASGSGYMGIISFLPPATREIVGTTLISSLSIGQKYFVKITVSFAERYSKVANNKLGVKFTNVQHSFTYNSPINNQAHVYTNSVISDSIGWTKIFGSFVADSNYQYIEIGNFFDTPNTTTVGIGYQSYYYLDDVCVSTDSLFTYNWSGPAPDGIADYENPIQTLMLYPNPSLNGIVFLNYKVQNGSVGIFDIYGTKVKSIHENNITEIDVSDLKSGVYYLNIRDGKSSTTKKLLINN